MKLGMKVRVDNSYHLVLDKKKAKRTFRKAGSEILAAARAKLRGKAGSGRKYALTAGGTYRASAPGQAPASRTGTLRASGKVGIYPSGQGFAVRFRAFYAPMLEGGSRGPGRRVLDPRPFLSAALEEKADSIATRIQAAIVDGIEFKRIGAKR